MEACCAADKQRWYVKRLSEVPRRMVPTHRDTAAATRCLEAVRTGLKMTPCERHQNGHRWHGNVEPTM